MFVLFPAAARPISGEGHYNRVNAEATVQFSVAGLGTVVLTHEKPEQLLLALARAAREVARAAGMESGLASVLGVALLDADPEYDAGAVTGD
jgi:hypothetical protein